MGDRPGFRQEASGCGVCHSPVGQNQELHPGPNAFDDEAKEDAEDATYEVNDDSFAEYAEDGQEDDDDEATKSDAETRHATTAAGATEASTSQVRVEASSLNSSNEALKHATEIGATAVLELTTQNPDATP